MAISETFSVAVSPFISMIMSMDGELGASANAVDE
jgi:hypothetical protein